MAAPGEFAAHITLYARQGSHLIVSNAATFWRGRDPVARLARACGAVRTWSRLRKIHRSQVIAKKILRLATYTGTNATGHPIVNLKAVYPASPWIGEGKEQCKQVLNILQTTQWGLELVNLI